MDTTRLAALLLALAASFGAAAADVEAEVAAAIRARLDAYRAGDADAWAKFVDDDCVCSGETKATIRAAIADRPAGVKASYGEPRELRVHPHGDVAIARYRVEETIEVEGRRQTSEQWRTETYRKRDGGWLLIAGAENAIAPDPVALALPRDALARFVGAYEYTPGARDVVTLDGDRLFVQPSGEAKVELFAETAGTFFAKGQPWRLVFHTDGDGAVDALVFRQDGQEYVARRVAE
ncbi:MAG TPA: DUF4440 domain-containing protein [Xanthomonadales bacterium]|nr:DUF4440 domain-containing protein [Xanthomonadales bacterium]